MTEIKFIQTTITENSLIIIDELCRSTAVEEGTALAMAICEDLARTKAYVFVTTHFTLLTRLADMYLNIRVWQMEAIPSGDFRNMDNFKLDFKFSLVPGVTTLKGYGFYMVRNGFPRTTLKFAQNLLRELPDRETDLVFCKVDEKMRLKYQLECKLRKLKEQNKLTVTELNNHLNLYQDELRKLGEHADENNDEVVQELSNINHSIFDAPQLNQNNLSNLQTSKIFLSDFHSQDQSPAAENFHISPRMDLSCDETECSLNLTQNAIGLFGANAKKHNESLVPSQMSEGELSQEVQRIRENRTPDSHQDSLFKHPRDFISISERMKSPSDENSFKELTNEQFSLPLDYDRTKTSTPLLKKFEENTKNLSSPKLNFTIVSGDISDVEMELVREDIESFILEIRNEEKCFEEDVDNDNVPKNRIVNTSVNEEELLSSINNRLLMETDSHKPDNGHFDYNKSGKINIKKFMSDSLYSTSEQHIFPVVHIKEGPNNLTPPTPEFSSSSEKSLIRSSPSISYSPLASFNGNARQDIPNTPTQNNRLNEQEKQSIESNIDDMNVAHNNELFDISIKQEPSFTNFGGNTSADQEDSNEQKKKDLDQNLDKIVSNAINNVSVLEKSIKLEPEDFGVHQLSSALSLSRSFEGELNVSVKTECMSQIETKEVPNSKILAEKEALTNEHDEKCSKRLAPENVDRSTKSVDNNLTDSSQYFTAATEDSPTLEQSKIKPEKKITIIENKILKKQEGRIGFKKRRVQRPRTLGMKRIHKNLSSTKRPNPRMKDEKPMVKSNAESHALNRNSDQSDSNEFEKVNPSIQSPKSSQKGKTSTSISEASKMRNLEGNGTTSSTSDRVGMINLDENPSLSEASKKRNLDAVTSSSEIDKTQTLLDDLLTDAPGSADSTVSDNFLPKKRIKKSSSNLQKPKPKKKFVPPVKKINITEVKQQYFQQDKKMWFENISDSTDCEKLFKQRLNRPSVRQIKQIECLATLVKTNEGIEVIPAPKNTVRTYKKRNEVQKLVCASRSNSIDMSLFSDKNAKSFDAFINSDQKCFPFNFGLQEKKPKDGNLFNFQRDDNAS